MSPSFSSREELDAFLSAELHEKGPASEKDIQDYVQRYWTEGDRDLRESYSMVERCRAAWLLKELEAAEEPYRLAWQTELETRREEWLSTEEASRVRAVFQTKTSSPDEVTELMRVASADAVVLATNGVTMNPEAFAESHWHTRQMFDLVTEVNFAETVRGMEGRGL